MHISAKKPEKAITTKICVSCYYYRVLVKKLEVLYEDDLCLVLNKPAGLAVQGGKGVNTSLDKILAQAFSPPPLLVHRLDKDTSGLILTAKTREAAAFFSKIFEKRDTVKQYTAVCLGCPASEKGIIKEDLLIRGSVKKSETRYKVRKTGVLFPPEEGQTRTGFSVLELTLGTGRMHQIRRHLAMTGTPILGDDKYGDFALNKKLRKTTGLKRLLLHASRLVVPGSSSMDICAPLPDYFSSFV